MSIKQDSIKGVPVILDNVFHSAHPTGWAESKSGIGLTMFVRPSSLRRWTISLLVGFTDPYIIGL